MDRRVVITGMGVMSPLGRSPAALWAALSERRSGVHHLVDRPNVTGGAIPDFQQRLSDFGSLRPAVAKTLRKSLKQMGRDTMLGLAALLQAWEASGLVGTAVPPARRGVIQGAGYVGIHPEAFVAGWQSCCDHASSAENNQAVDAWGEWGINQVAPLWMLTCLPNMAGCYAAILEDCQGPNNTITIGGAAANLAIADSYESIREGAAEVMLAGGCGSRLDSYSLLHMMGEIDVAPQTPAPEEVLRPFDRDRTGSLPAEGAAAFVLEEARHARDRGAKVWGEILGYGSACVMKGFQDPGFGDSFVLAMEQALESANLSPDEIGHLHAHGASSRWMDVEEAEAIRQVFGNSTDTMPITALKSYMGDACGGSGALEVAASLLAMAEGRTFPVLNHHQTDPDCPIHLARHAVEEVGDCFLNLNIAAEGQATALVVRRAA